MRNRKALAFIWDKLHAYSEHSLDNMIGNYHHEDPEIDNTYAEEWAEICEAMAYITEHVDKSCINARYCQHVETSHIHGTDHVCSKGSERGS